MMALILALAAAAQRARISGPLRIPVIVTGISGIVTADSVLS
jgi:hypothetical protein